jgi:hypothetical protein
VGLKKLIFYTSFFLLFLVGGTINFYGLLPFKMAYVSFLPFLLFPFCKIKNNLLFQTAVFYFLCITLSAILNKTQPLLTLLYFQYAAMPFLIYYLVSHYINENNIHFIFKICFYLALIQLPVLLVQKAFFVQLSSLGVIDLLEEDFASGTFYTSNDPALAFFLFCILLFLLFENELNYFIKHKLIYILWITLTILVLNSKLGFLILGLIYIFYGFKKLSTKVLISILVSLPIIFCLLWFSGLQMQIQTNINGLVHHFNSIYMDLNGAAHFYLKGDGNRAYALVYLLSQPLSFIGQGPYYSFNPFTKEYFVGGDSGLLINTYINLVLMGLFVIYFYLYSFLKVKPINAFSIKCFLILLAYSLTVDIFIDASMMMAFHIFTYAYLLKRENTLVAA